MTHQNPNIHSGKQSIRLTHNTWRIHDVEKVGFASGVWQDHCDRGALDTNSSLRKRHKIEINFAARDT